MFDIKKSVLQEIHLNCLNTYSVKLFIKRDDLIDSIVSGNKWRKLKYNVENALSLKNNGILTFGGAYSNHLIATAAACQKAGLESIGIVRGEELTSDSNDTLKKCEAFGMKLIFVSREAYAMRNEKLYQEELSYEYSNFYIVPEGGCNYYGMVGCQEILLETPNNFDHVFVAQGTTTTSAGIAMVLSSNSTLHVVPVLKGFDSKSEMKNLYRASAIENDYVNDIMEKIEVSDANHFGGYGKYTDELLDFMEEFYLETGIPLDPIYTGKAIFAMVDWIKKHSIPNETYLFVHTGGIQGGKAIAKKEGRTFFNESAQ